jgi:hypothetical protein
MIKLAPTCIAVWPYLGVGAGPEHGGYDHAITSRSRT